MTVSAVDGIAGMATERIADAADASNTAKIVDGNAVDVISIHRRPSAQFA